MHAQGKVQSQKRPYVTLQVDPWHTDSLQQLKAPQQQQYTAKPGKGDNLI